MVIWGVVYYYAYTHIPQSGNAEYLIRSSQLDGQNACLDWSKNAGKTGESSDSPPKIAQRVSPYEDRKKPSTIFQKGIDYVLLMMSSLPFLSLWRWS